MGVLSAGLLALGLGFGVVAAVPAGVTIHDFTAVDIDGRAVDLSIFQGRVVLVVNTASRCGYTSQYEGLEALFREYQARGLVVLGFPANSFGNQEPGTDAEIKAFCTGTYGVTFPMFAKIAVTGPDTHPLYRYLITGGGNTELEGPVKWNFTKFLIDRSGRPIARFDSRTRPQAPELIAALEAALGG